MDRSQVHESLIKTQDELELALRDKQEMAKLLKMRFEEKNNEFEKAFHMKVHETD